MAAEIATFMKMFPETWPIYWETPKKQSPHTNQLKQIARVRARSRGVRNRAMNEARSSVLLLTSTTIFWVNDARPSVDRPFLKGRKLILIY